MDMDYVDAINALVEDVSSAAARANERGLSDKEVAAELRRIATDIEREGV